MSEDGTANAATNEEALSPSSPQPPCDPRQARRAAKVHVRRTTAMAQHIAKLLCDWNGSTELSVRAHDQAMNVMRALRVHLMDEEHSQPPNEVAQESLLSAGLSVFDASGENTTHSTLLSTTSMLLFDLMFCCSYAGVNTPPTVGNEDVMDEDDDPELVASICTVDTWMDGQWGYIFNRAMKETLDETNGAELGSDTGDHASEGDSTGLSPGQVCQLLGRKCARDANVTQLILYDMSILFYVCARESSRTMLLHEFLPTVPNHSPLSEEARDRLQATIDAGSSELGASALKDLLLSFILPRRVIGCRKSILIDRNTAKIATEQYPLAVARAHETAQSTAAALWARSDEEDACDLDTNCALLAGIAMLLCTTAHDARRGTAFGGRISLPFLRASTPPSGPRIVLSESEWTCYVIKPGGSIEVLYRGEKSDGLKRCILILLDALSM
jgi:hypothetical protein